MGRPVRSFKSPVRSEIWFSRDELESVEAAHPWRQRLPAAWDNEISARLMPKRYTSRELIKLAEEFGWRLVSVTGDHHNFKHPESRFIVTIVHPQKDVPVGRAVDTVKKIRLELK
jgi:predicted RNA binding protein YcfA (HicA-like mRNA interferase family)